MSRLFRLLLGVMIMGGTVYFSTKLVLSENNDNYTKITEEKSESEETKLLADSVILDVPLLNQMDAPRLKSGCEITSLAMILNYKGIQVSKNQLAVEIPRVPLRYNSGEYGNPNIGFVGNMEDGPGLGVNHVPLFNLAKNYVGDRASDLTQQPFEVLLSKVAKGNPVWILTTKTFAPVSDFMTWQTPQGPVDVTYSMHSVVITGYDKDSIYINNPYGQKNQKVERGPFIAAWEQMGKQSIVIE